MIILLIHASCSCRTTRYVTGPSLAGFVKNSGVYKNKNNMYEIQTNNKAILSFVAGHGVCGPTAGIAAS